MTQPNFVFIMTDSQGANNIGAYGRPELQTPHLDRLAAEGIRFERAYTTCPICTPARGGIFTGEYPHTCGAWANELPLTLTTHTMGQRFRDNGYHTAFIGKWHLCGQDYFDTGICPDGWDDAYWFDGRRYMSELTDEEIRLWRQVLTTTEALKEYDVPAEFTWGHRISERAIRFLQQPREQPFVLVLSYDEPHGPCTCPKEYVERFEDYIWDPGPSKHDDMCNKPTLHRRFQDHFRNTWEFTEDGCLYYPPFFACNSFVDAEIGAVLAAVDRLAPPNTWVIFTSDHGQYMGAHGLNGKGLVMYEEAAHIPLIVRPPDRTLAGTVDRTLVSHVDILPTMLEIAGLEVPPVLEGESLVPNVTRGEQRSEKEVVIEWNRADVDNLDLISGLYPSRCLLSGNYKLVVNLLDTDELYDLAADPHEMANRIDDPALAAIRDTMHDHLVDWMNDTRDPFRGPGWLERPWHTSASYRHDPHGLKYPRPADGYLPPTLDYMTGKPWQK